ncbi:MAG TPA: ATP-binding protein [Gammaproteobacteria bacterium]
MQGGAGGFSLGSAIAMVLNKLYWSMDTPTDFRLLFESAPGLYLVLTPDLTIAAVSDAYAEATMTRREQILGRGLFEVFPDNPDDPAADGVSKLRASLASVLKNKKTHTMAVQKYDIRRPDGTFEVRYWSPINKPVLNTKKQIIYIIHRVEDVTDFVAMQNEQLQKEKIAENLQRKVEEMEREIYKRSLEIKKMNAELEQKVIERSAALVRAEQRYQHIIDNMMEGMQVIDHDFRYVYVNDSLVKQGKHSREELLGHTMMEKYPGIENTEFFKLLQHCIRTRTPRAMENEFHFSDGSVGFFALSIQPIDEGVFILSTDISERKRAERELAMQNKKLQSQNRELEQFAFIASHDLQEPLRSIKGFSELLQQDLAGKLDEETSRYLGFILASAERMKQLVKDLLDYSRLGKERHLERVDCNRIVAEVLVDLAAAIEESKAEITVQSLPVLQGYATELRQLFQNLIGNAIKFRKKDTAPEITVSAQPQQGGGWRFAVQDKGIGIESQYKNKIFIIFQRLHKRDEYGGTGIGLAQCKKIVELHGGEIWVESSLGNGSIFYFTILGFET